MPSFVAVGSEWTHCAYRRQAFRVVRSGRRWVTLESTSPLAGPPVKVAQENWPLMGGCPWTLAKRAATPGASQEPPA